jgi:MYXO-CTERM domain-containing protein
VEKLMVINDPGNQRDMLLLAGCTAAEEPGDETGSLALSLTLLAGVAQWRRDQIVIKLVKTPEPGEISAFPCTDYDFDSGGANSYTRRDN